MTKNANQPSAQSSSQEGMLELTAQTLEEVTGAGLLDVADKCFGSCFPAIRAKAKQQKVAKMIDKGWTLTGEEVKIAQTLPGRGGLPKPPPTSTKPQQVPRR